MTPNDAFDTLFAEGHRTLDTVMADMPQEMLAWQPPGTALPIGMIFAHAVGLEDLYLRQIIQQQPLLWQEQSWERRLGHPQAPNQWNILKLLPPDMAELRAYQAAVFAQSRAYVHALSASDFDQPLTFPGSTWSMTIGQLLGVVVAHTFGHAGEIAALKGVQGAKGLPF
jgi:hypothetical protein